MTVNMSMWFEYTDENTPTKSEAKRGDFNPTFLAETEEQLKLKLVWIRCPFCGGYVLLLALPDAHSRKREKCQCGARRISRYVWRGSEIIGYEDGWRKNNEEWTSLE